MALEQVRHQNKMAQNEIKSREETIGNMQRQLQDMKDMHSGARDEVGIYLLNQETCWFTGLDVLGVGCVGWVGVG